MGFFYDQYFEKPTYPTESFAGKTVIVTGSNTGLGREAARHFVRLGADRVVIAVRNVDKGLAAKKSIDSSESVKDDQRVQVWKLDLGSYTSVQAFAARAEKDLTRIDALVENAAIATTKYNMLEGHEATITTNVISTFLLACLLLPKLKETASKFQTRPHLTIVSSGIHASSPLDERLEAGKLFDALDLNEERFMKNRYPTSKLLEVLVMKELFESGHCITNPEAYPVVINMVCPGLCHSELGRDAGLGFMLFKIVMARTTEVGSRTLVNAALEAGPQSQGKFLAHCRVSQTSPFVNSEEGAKTATRVWDELAVILNEIVPDVTKNI